MIIWFGLAALAAGFWLGFQFGRLTPASREVRDKAAEWVTRVAEGGTIKLK